MVLSWPSVEGETYIVQYRQTVDTNSSWITLTNYLPADAGTNLTFFVHSNQVGCSSGGSFSGGGSSGGPAAPDSAMMQATVDTIAPVTQLDDATILFLAQHEVFPPYAWDREHRPPYVWELEARPPFPWDPGAIRPAEIESSPVRTLAPSGVSFNSYAENEPQPEGDGDDGGDPPSYGFYRVVRDGVHFFGLTNGAVLSGNVTFPIEICFDDGVSVDGFYVSTGTTNETFPLNGFEIDDVTNGLPTKAFWDTRQVTNGTYQLFLGCQYDESGYFEAPPVSVAVSNLIWFPDSWNVAGYYLDVEAQSVHTNGTYHVDIYDDTGFNVLQVDGTNDAEGFITYGGYRGFLVINYDEYGEQYPSTYYAVAVRTAPAGGGATAATANVVKAEFVWPRSSGGWTKFAIGYQPVFGNPVYGGVNAVLLQSMIQNVYESAQNRPGGLGVIRGSDQNPFELWSMYDFSNLLLVSDLRDDQVRNFYYFGHGGARTVGNRVPKNHFPNPAYIGTSDLTLVLRNNLKDPLADTNAHPFRFVWVDSCETANGDLCKAFGIPKQKNMPASAFNNRGVRYRAFMGWDEKFVGAWGAVNETHLTFVSDFWWGWQLTDTNGWPFTLRRAVDYAAKKRDILTEKPSWAKHLIIYGYEGLIWSD